MQVVCAFMNHLNSESHNRIFFVDFPVISNCVVLCVCMHICGYTCVYRECLHVYVKREPREQSQISLFRDHH